MTDWEQAIAPEQTIAGKSKTDWEAEYQARSKETNERAQAYRDEQAAMLEEREDRLAPRQDVGFERDPDRGADIRTIAGTSFADDPAVKIEHYARRRFPNMPIEEAIQNYGLVKGEIVYRGEDGKVYTETPRMVDRIAKHLGKGIPMATGTAAGVLTAPLWLTGPAGATTSAGLTSASAYAGEEIRQNIGEKITGDPVSKTEPLKEGGYALAGEAVGGVATKVMGRHVARDIAKMDKADVEVLQRLSKKYGIDLTPAELTDLPSLKARQKALGNLPDSSDTMTDFYKRRAGQVDDAVTDQLDAISTVDSGEIAGELTRSAARRSMSEMAELRAKAASPLYKKAFKEAPEVDIDPVVDFIDTQLVKAKGSIKTSLQKARKFLVDPPDPDAVKEAKKLGLMEPDEVYETSLEGLHNAKLAIDDMIGTGHEEGIGNVAKGKLKQLQKRLLAQIDATSPEYKKARGIFADLSPEVSKVREGVVGVIADLKDENLQKAAAKLFNPKMIGPRTARLARIQIKASDPEAWQAIKRSWLQEQWDTASKEFATTGNLNRGSKFRALLFGDKQRQKILKETLDPAEYKALDELSNVLQAAGRVKPVGSDTAWNQELMKIARDEATPALAKVAEKINVLGWPRMISEWATEKNLKKMSARMAEVITRPGAMKELKQLRQVTPNSARAAVLTAHILGIGSSSAAGGAVDTVFEEEPQYPK